MKLSYYIIKSVATIFVLIISAVVACFITGTENNSYYYRRYKGGKWYKYYEEDLDDYFWSNDLTLNNKITDIENYDN